jgi:hypothetical protein
MNWLDIFLIILNVILFIVGITTIVVAIVKRNDSWSDATVIAVVYWVCYLFVIAITIKPFVVLDKASGSTIGLITSVDKNFFGTTAVYVKTSETEQEKYCIENEDISNKAKELIGKNVKIEYGTRVGLYSTGKCNQAPVSKIEELKEDKQ